MATILTPKLQSVEGSCHHQVSWKQAMKTAIRSGRELCEFVGVDPQVACPEAEGDFPVFAPLEFARRIRPRDPADPLLRQVLASPREQTTDGLLDPVGDLDSQSEDGLLQKYEGRALLITTGACAIHCRYCFRRHFPYHSLSKAKSQWQTWLSAIRQDDSIHEVILSGGDPLTVSDSVLQEFVEGLDQIKHVRKLRLHTRTPVVIPQRVTSEMLHWLASFQHATFIVLHVNHRQEIDSHVERAIKLLRESGAVLLNQAVLLKGVNDSEQALFELCETLSDLQVLPYYLHQLDPVQGGMHFAVDDSSGQQLMEQLRGRLPGYAVPNLVREVPGAASKIPI